MVDEGYTKYTLEWEAAPFPEGYTRQLEQLIALRDELRKRGLIGVLPDGIGFGNVSLRPPGSGDTFIISGTQTGHLTTTQPAHYSLVTQTFPAENRVVATGPVAPSSESMSHAAVYKARQEISVVIHVHHTPTWELLLKQLPATAPDTPYGTPQMAQEIMELVLTPPTCKQQIFAMAGHQGGIIAFGSSIAEARAHLYRYVSASGQCSDVQNG